MNVLNQSWNNLRVLVTGVPGFKASWLAALLVAMGADVSAICRRKRDPFSAYAFLGIQPQVTHYYADIANFSEVHHVIANVRPDVIFHLAATALVPVALRSPLQTYETNVMGTANIIEACRQLKVCQQLLICSTDHVFGDPPNASKSFVHPPGDSVGFAGPYDTSKAAMELMVRSYYANYYTELPAIGITRSANVFGPGDTNQRRVIPAFLQSALRDQVIHLKYRKNGRQFIHVTDVIAGYIRAASVLEKDRFLVKSLRRKGLTGMNGIVTPTFHFAIETYEETADPYLRLESLAQIISGIVPCAIDDTETETWAPNEIRNMALNCSETRKTLNWQTLRTLTEGLGERADWYRAGNDTVALKAFVQRDLARILDSLKV